MCFGWFFPFFFVGAGVKLHFASFIHDLTTALLVPLFLAALLLVRDTPAWFYGKHLAAPERLPFALYSSVAPLSLVVITDIGVRPGAVSPHIASALIGAALLSVLSFPTLVGVLRPLAAAPPGTAEASVGADAD